MSARMPKDQNPMKFMEMTDMSAFLKTTGLVVPALLCLAGCGAEVAPEAAPVSPKATTHNLDTAMRSGRLQIVPEGLSASVASSDAAVIATRSAAVAGEKSADPWQRPQSSYQDEGLRQLELSAAQSPSPGLELSFELGKTDYVLGEPIFARATITNVSDQPLRVAPQLDPQFTYGHIVVETPAGDTLGLKPLAIACSRGDLQVETLAPGDSRTQDFPIYFGSQGSLFTEPGTYKVELLYRGITEDSGRVDAEPVYLTVHGGGEDIENAAALAMDGEAGLFMMWGEGDHLTQGIANLELLTQLYPQSPITDAARFAMGRNASVDFMNGVTRTERKADPAQALRHLGPLVQDLLSGDAMLDAGRTRDAFVMLGRAQARLGHHDAARAVLADYLDAFGAEATADDVTAIRDALQGL